MNKLFFTALVAVMVISSCSSDNSENGGTPMAKQVLGHIEKGPFVQGSEVTLTDLNSDLSQTGKQYTTSTTSDLGHFDFGQTLPLSSGLVELKTSGYFYNECTGQLSNSQITLKAIADAEGKNDLNVNLLTHLEYARVKYLVKNGVRFKQAKEQSEAEILRTFAITDKMIAPEKVSLTDNDKNANILLAVSSIMLYDKTEAEFSELIARFSTDLEHDGKIDDIMLLSAIKEGQAHCHPSEIKKNMETFYQAKGSTVTIGDFSSYIDFNGDGVINDKDEEEKELEVSPDDKIEESNFWSTEQNAKDAIAGVYISVRDYIILQNELDAQRIKNENTKDITSSSSLVRKAWDAAYTADSRAVYMLRAMETQSFSYDIKPYILQMTALRAFLLYNMAVEWGRIPVIDDYSSVNAVTSVSPSETEDIFKRCLHMMNNQIPSMEGSTTFYFTPKAANLLKAEIYLTLGQKAEAKRILSSVSQENVFEMSLDMDTKIPIYSAEYVKYLKDEANGNDCSNEWYANRKTSYGTFAALRRLSAVQRLTGIDNHFNLLPIPNVELSKNPRLKQNPGY